MEQPKFAKEPVHLKSVESRGRELYMPNCDFAKMLCEITKRKSLSSSKIRCLKRNGYVVNIDQIKE